MEFEEGTEFEDDTQWDYVGQDPTTQRRAELRINDSTVEFLLPRRKGLKKYTVVFDAKWPEIVSYDCSEIVVCDKEQTWPLGEPLPKGMKPKTEAAIFFAFLRAKEEAFFQIWAVIPREDLPRVTSLAEEYLSRPPVPGLAHHGTAAAVRYVIDRCNVVERFRLKWHDWLKAGPSTKPNPKFRERGPDLVVCKEGMAFDFYGAGPKLEQMSTFWPWRLIKEITPLTGEVNEIAYVWHEDNYTFKQQVWDMEEHGTLLDTLKRVHQQYLRDDTVPELKLIRPWSFPSRFHETWDHLQPFASKASREGFPPIFEDEP